MRVKKNNFTDNKLDSVPIHKIIKKIENVLNSFEPEIIFTHSQNCLNIDHQITHKATITACRPIKKKSTNKKKVIAYTKFFWELIDLFIKYFGT